MIIVQTQTKQELLSVSELVQHWFLYELPLGGLVTCTLKKKLTNQVMLWLIECKHHEYIIFCFVFQNSHYCCDWSQIK